LICGYNTGQAWERLNIRIAERRAAKSGAEPTA
jgi:hypothetical protein